MAIDPETQAWSRKLPHLQRLGRTYFITFVTRARRVLPDVTRTATLETIVAGHLRSYALYAAVVMPDHVHLIITVYPHTTLAKTMKFIKSVSKKRAATPVIWQREYFDRIVRHDEDLRGKGEYLVANPIRAGLVASGDEYLWIWRSWVEGETKAPQGTAALQRLPESVP